MIQEVLYERLLPPGPAVRIRRTSPEGEQPVTAVLEVERRAGTPREGVGFPPALLMCEADSEGDAVARLRQEADDDRAVARLMLERGLR